MQLRHRTQQSYAGSITREKSSPVDAVEVICAGCSCYSIVVAGALPNLPAALASLGLVLSAGNILVLPGCLPARVLPAAVLLALRFAGIHVRTLEGPHYAWPAIGKLLHT